MVFHPDLSAAKDLLAPLIAKQSVNPPGNESLVTNVVKSWFDAWGIPYEEFEGVAGRANLVGTIGSSGPVIIIVGHSDVVPAGDGWQSDPFTLTEKAGLWYGRGTVDNKGPMASILLAAKELKEHEAALQCTVKVVIAADEERGSGAGIIHVLEKGLTGDMGIIPDIGGHLENIDVAEKGRLEVVVTATGRQGHGAYPSSGKNAITLLAKFIAAVEQITFDYQAHPFLSAPTLNVGMVSGGAAANMIPGKAQATIDIRFLPGMREEAIMGTLETSAKEIDQEAFSFEVTDRLLPTSVPADHALVTKLQASIKAVTGKDAGLEGTSGATIAKPLNEAGIPSIGCGIGDGDLMHVADEHIDPEEILQLARVLVDFCERQ